MESSGLQGDGIGAGVLLGRNLAEGTPVFYDRFSSGAMNGHMVVMAGSTWDRLLFTRLMVIREAQRGLACLPD